MAYIVQHLIPDSQTPVTLVIATEEMTIQDAVERMIEHDFSQLPIVDNDHDRKLKGLITSDSILRAVRYFRSPLDKIKVSHASLDVKTCRPDDDISELLNGLRDASAIPIVDKTGKLIAIVTNYDTAEYYRQRAEDIMLAEDIETTLRDYIETAYKSNDGNIDSDALRKAIEGITPSGKDFKNKFKQALCSYLGRSKQIPPQPDQKLIDEMFMQYLHQPIEIKSFEDLTLFEYIQLFKNLWNKYEADFKYLDWGSIDTLLSEVRQTRNAIAHFREVMPNQRKQLKFCASLLDRHRPAPEEVKSPNEPITAVIEDNQIFSDKFDVPLEPAERSGGEFDPIDEELGLNESRYAPLAIWLQGQIGEGNEKISLTFEQIEKIIDDKLPASARQHRNWWANDTVSHAQSQQWLDVGWRVSNVNMAQERVVFSLMSDRQSAYIKFFNDLQPKLNSIEELTIKPAMNLQGRSWLVVQITSSEIPDTTWLSFSFARKSRFRVECYIYTGDQSQNKRIFDSLYARKTEIEAALGESLSWERMDHKQASRVALYHEEASITNSPEELTELQDWAIRMMPRFYRAIAPHLHKEIHSSQAS
ncbi:DUF4268 domain-containing protein [Egbenema bharatensis]|uniref:DUF4268 domain-containing protein n=1 Tax=Egbenema bharatensis TaxID=3463334 RepID=UPI003A874B1D